MEPHLQPRSVPSARSDSDRDVGERVSIISSNLTIIGHVNSNGNVKLDGVIHGDMFCSSLVVSESGEIKGGIVADDVVVLGQVHGPIRGKKVMLHATAQVEGDIYHQGIGIEMGTRYDGTLRWIENAEDLTSGADLSGGGAKSASASNGAPSSSAVATLGDGENELA